MPTLPRFARLSRPGAARSASSPAAASPATPRCSAAATSSSPPQTPTIGMGGPAMIEGGGLGVFTPEEIGPIDVQVPNGVVDIAVADEAEAVAVGQAVPVVLPGPARASGSCADQRLLRRADPGEPAARLRHPHGDRRRWPTPARCWSCAARFGSGMVTALIRVEGRPIGVIANNPMHLGGAIDADGADKARALHAALRRLRHPDPVAVRHAGHHGRAGGGEDRAGPPRLPHVRRSAPA